MTKRQSSKIYSIALATALLIYSPQTSFANDTTPKTSSEITTPNDNKPSPYEALSDNLSKLESEKPFSLSDELMDDILKGCINNTEELEHRVIETYSISIENFFSNDQFESETRTQLDKRLREINRELEVIGNIKEDLTKTEECLISYPQVYSTHSQRFSRMRHYLEKAFFNYYKSAHEFITRFEYSENKQSNMEEFPQNFWKHNL